MKVTGTPLWVILILSAPLYGGRIPEPPPIEELFLLEAKTDFDHKVGKATHHGWELDYKRDKPGYALSQMKHPWLLEKGLYRVTFNLRRGQYPRKGLFFKSYGLFQLELWDVTTQEIIVQRELQVGDFSGPGVYEPRWIEFSMSGREGHAIEPRVYWIGLANGEIKNVQLSKFPMADSKTLEKKARRLEKGTLANHLENGFVVSRQIDGQADETGDATTYTGFYVTALAWKYAATKDALTYQALENGLETLHNAIKGTYDEPLLTRFVDEEGTPFPKDPSKDIYTAFFLAHAAAYPHISNTALKNQMRNDVERIASKFLRDDLRIKSGPRTLVSLTPYLTDEEIQSGIQILMNNQKQHKKFIKSLKSSRRYMPFGELWPGMKSVIQAVERKDQNELLRLVTPTLNGAFTLGERVRDILREQYREDLFPKRFNNKGYPGIKLADLITSFLKRYPPNGQGSRVNNMSDLKILASNALISLHIVKTAAVITKNPQFEEYYKANLYTQDALLKTAEEWLGMEDLLVKLTSGNAAADAERRGYLGTLALMNLITLEKNPAVKQTYQALMLREWKSYQNDDNPLMAAIAASIEGENSPGMDLVRRALTFYPENRMGFGQDFWEDYGRDVADILGGGEYKNYSREALPVSHRPKDSFLWQRNARRLQGDMVKLYPATDYLFVYWFARAHDLLPAPPLETTANP
ncbi:MAG: hypothetical protein KCHDKBKB_01989 [Elusimicrobia bacterium]|nr:hypothetical protein [Elusimicrobiota bacterium]